MASHRKHKAGRMQPSRVAHYLTVPAQATPAIFIVVFALLMSLARLAGLFGLWLGVLLFFGFILTPSR